MSEKEYLLQQVGMSEAEVAKLEREAIERINVMIAQGQAMDLLSVWSDHGQTCNYVYDVLLYAANKPDDEQLVSAQNFARNLLDDWSK